MDEVTITHDNAGDRGEYRAEMAGTGLVGRLTWTRRGTVRVAEHTLVPRAFEGRGIAARLVDALIADARADGVRIDPACSYVAARFRRHPEWRDLLA
jgi:predicted GNAT family acetyltransferase